MTKTTIGISEIARRQKVPLQTVQQWIARRQLLASDGGRRVFRSSYKRFLETGSAVQGAVDPPPDRRGVYFVMMGEFVKIGCSGDVVRRWLVQTDTPEPAIPLGFLSVPRSVRLLTAETDVHIRFRHLRYRGEWFRFAPELQDFIREHAKPWPERR